MKQVVQFKLNQTDQVFSTSLIQFSPSKSSQGVFKNEVSESQHSFKSFKELKDEFNITHHQHSQFYDSSFNSIDIIVETEMVDEDNKTPKIANFNKNNLMMKKQYTRMDNKQKSTNFEAFLLIGKYFFSVGILALPYMFYLTGFILGSLLIIFTAAMTIYSIHLIMAVHLDIQSKVDPSQVKQTTTITELAFKIFGVPGQLSCRIFSTIANLGSCISYIIFFEIYISGIIQEQWSNKITNEQAHLIGALFAFTIILPLSTVNNITLFWQTNLVGFLVGLIAVLWMLYLDFSLILGTGGVQRSENDLWKTDNFFLAVGISVYSFQVMGIALNIRNSMENPNNFIPVFYTSTILTCLMYLVFGIVTQLAIGEYTEDIVLLNFAPQTIIGFCVRLMYTISVLLSYPLKFYVVVQIYENLKCFKDEIFSVEKYEMSEYKNFFDQSLALLKRYAIRYVLIVSIFMLSLTTYKLAKIISLVGSLGSIILQFVIPQLVYMRYFKVQWYRIIFGITICLIFVISACLGVFYSLMSLSSNH
ncbi:transmembrane amino acid transporter protein (macronuclear) [Tetrahymena thermophila SB210]|uniref:Transmembrane amino acid transporter protein n=1 Tax=Tetrahymena thermophila (strain SB210) TaxID=312017 RepID=I7M440_TETTS|nr:transmembrane amino acid transporter protein [Tetrahymena thermophila SB210]EAS04852.2 transmembrane amino acid transporter protein [Tetrahymena thermophila SB210]|eukprot:XP_001025097.2 transmembrane amino acid transporter protein [Tetrahymena thermophila SB210]